MQQHQTHAKSEYPNGNGNGNGQTEETREEVVRKIAPEIRREIRQDSRLSVGAKFFFYCLLDDAFWKKVGGQGTGQLFAAIKDLAKRYNHDPDSIRAWRDELIKNDWLWWNDEWPLGEWRLTPLMPAPETSPHRRGVQMALGHAAKATTEQNRNFPFCPDPKAKPTVSSGKTESAAEQNRNFPSAKPKLSVGKTETFRRHDGKRRLSKPKDSVLPTEGIGLPDGKVPFCRPEKPVSPTEPVGFGPEIHTRPLGRSDAREKSPEVGAVGAVGDPNLKRLGNRAQASEAKRGKLRQRADTEEFLNLVREVCGAAEIEKNSGLWVNNLHADPALAFETMHDTKSARTEHRIKITAARHAMDFWKRRWLQKHPDQTIAERLAILAGQS